ncbi:MAG: FecR family protein [Polyangiaceae bacterium]|jgi:hypothetical protein|nr:FecR family protein [Polyangiaceae bacterium]
MSDHLQPARLDAIAGGDAPSDDEAEHLLECPSCQGVIDASLGLPQLSAQLRSPALPPVDPGAPLRAFHALPRPRLRLASAAALAALAAAWALWPRAAPFAVEPAPGALVENIHTGDDRVLSLRGEATFRVQKLPAGHRFRVRSQADEVEVKGTVFLVEGGDGGVKRVEVQEGAVEVRTACCGTHLVPAGGRWVRPQLTEAPAEAPAPTAAPSASAAQASASGSAAPPRAPGEPAEELLRRGLAAFDAGNFAQASAALARASALEPHAPWARDARTLAGAARVMSAPVSGVAGLGVGAASFDKAAQRAASAGDGARAAAARLGAARASQGEARRRRYCALRGDPALPSSASAEVARECR